MTGQLFFAGISARATGTTITPPAGWNQVVTTGSTANLRQTVFYKVATGSEPSTYTFTLSASVKASGVIVSYAGINTTTPVEVSGGQPNASSTSITAPSVSPALSPSIMLGFYGNAHSDAITAPGTFTARGTDASTSNGVTSRTATLAAEKSLSTSGATGTTTATAASAGENIGQVLILKLQ